MKKLLVSVLLGCIMLTVVACGNDADTSNAEVQSENVETGNEAVTNNNVSVDSEELAMETLENAPETSFDEFRYVEFEGEVIISEFIGESEIVVIPDEINGCPVIEIARTAFRNNETVKAVRIGNNVKVIRDQAFINCASLEYVLFGENVEVLEEKTFLGCNILKEIRLNEGLLTIGELVFPDTVEPLVIPRSVTEIGDGAFNEPIQVYAGSYAEEFMKTYATYYDGYTYDVIE